MTAAAPPPRRLMRDTKNAILGGVCAGIAEFFGLDVGMVRVAYVVVSVLTAFSGALVYVVLWLVLPAKD